MAWDYLVAGSTAGVIEFAVRVGAAIDGITGFCTQCGGSSQGLCDSGVEDLDAGRSTSTPVQVAPS